jgi:hypothetical protein
MNKQKCIELLTLSGTNPLTLDKIVSEFIPEWLVWEPETVWSWFRSFTRKIPLIETKTKLNTTKFLHCSEAAWTEWEDFCRACDGLSSIVLDFDTLHKPSVPEVYVAMWTMQTLRPQLEVSEEVKRLLAAVCLDAGILFVPPPLDIVQPLLDTAEYRCTLCGNIDLLDNNECDTCGAPESALIIVPRYFDWTEVKNKWDSIKEMPLESVVLEENLIDIHLYKLLEAYATLIEFKTDHVTEMQYASS